MHMCNLENEQVKCEVINPSKERERERERERESLIRNVIFGSTIIKAKL